MNQSCYAYHIPVQAVCEGFFVFAAAICAFWATHKMFPGQHVQINPKFISQPMCIMTSWHLAFPGINPWVTSNPFCYYNFVLICRVVVIFKLSCSTDTPHVCLLQSFTFAMTHAQVVIFNCLLQVFAAATMAAAEATTGAAALTLAAAATTELKLKWFMTCS